MKADFTFFFLVVFLAAAIAGWQWPDIAKIMPVYVAALPGLALVLVQLYRDATAVLLPGVEDFRYGQELTFLSEGRPALGYRSRT